MAVVRSAAMLTECACKRLLKVRWLKLSTNGLDIVTKMSLSKAELEESLVILLKAYPHLADERDYELEVCKEICLAPLHVQGQQDA